MGFFSLQRSDAALAENSSTAITGEKPKTQSIKETKQPDALPMSKRPRFGQWLKAVLLDIITVCSITCSKMLLLGLITLDGLYGRYRSRCI